MIYRSGMDYTKTSLKLHYIRSFERIHFHSREQHLFIIVGTTAVSLLTGGYATRRNYQTLKDRYQHQQSIGLYNSESRNCWLGIGGFVLTVGTVVAGAHNAQKDAPLTLTMKSLAVSSCVLNGLAVTNGLVNIVDKYRNKEQITASDVFQFTSTILFFTNSVISTHEAMSLANTVGKNSSGSSSDVLRALMKQICQIVGNSMKCETVKIASFISSTVIFTLKFVSTSVGRKLIEITKSRLRGLTGMRNYMLEGGELLGKLWESWNKEIAEVVDLICRAFGVKHWSELVIRGCRLTEYGHIRAMAGTVIAENRSLLVQCGCTTMSSHQRQAISDNSAVVGTDDGPNSVVDGETQTYYDEIAHIFMKFVSRLKCRYPEDFCRYLRFVCEFVKVQFQKKKSHYEKSWDMVKRFNPDVKVEDFNKQYGISGNPNDHFLQEVFDEFHSEEEDVFTSLHLAYEKENAGTSAQEEDNGQVCLDVDGVRFYPFYSMRGLACNGMPSEQQYRELAAKLMGRLADRDSTSMSASGDTAVIQVNDEAAVIMVRCWEEDGKVSGIAAVWHTAAE